MKILPCRQIDEVKRQEGINQANRIAHGAEIYQQWLRSETKLKFILSLELEDYIAMQIFCKIKEDTAKTTT